MSSTDLRSLVREIEGFPRPGISFKDITPLLHDSAALDAAVAQLAALAAPLKPDVVLAAEARGFILGAALARELGIGFVPARKPGRLPHHTVSVEYALEYAVDELQVHTDAIEPGSRVLVHDDLLATGGTAVALCQLVARLGGEVAGCAFLVELTFLNGRQQLAPHDVQALIGFEA